ncbi:MAG: hypothetical protein PHP82_04420 [Candidatus ainarchaeum sp.]|nr:hypothetical protein [Candidatus ainarchaeum sp.]MDD5639737.1 hypothetical protein [Candidatus Paceibacterota bacterium]
MEKEKTKKNYSKIIETFYFYILGYFFISNAWFDYFASQKTSNKEIFYFVGILSLFFAISCFIKINSTRKKKSKKMMVLDFIVAVIIVYIGIKILCISNGGPMILF